MATKKLVSLDQYIAEQKPAEVTKPESHKVDAKKEGKTKRTEAVTKEQSLVLPTVKVEKPIPFRIIDHVRPQRGTALFSFTQAWLFVSGLLDGKGIDRAIAAKVAGTTAINYHLNKGNFESTKEGLKLTVAGQNFFAHRNPALASSEQRYDPKMVETFKAILTDGKMDGELVKQQNHIVSM